MSLFPFVPYKFTIETLFKTPSNSYISFNKFVRSSILLLLLSNNNNINNDEFSIH